ncbi:MarR family winged helix-turn-helix transcriptional regulator [Kibdelosporangium persicum]|uniref:Winged helix-turn-helix transcriptional regulator n=1 Tax=Kibdelosporangium persicum TaxID=2698649 RepID=A0ABX2F8C5_9PSEU|nr:MarR family transcriptional regulator [Kibdelosporangium persicum]NRN67394.1 Winged helix-turn-helix transcriptional regulator [Kibdelosporangium persicum]
MPATPEPRWLNPDELQAWRSFSLMMSRLTTALDSQLQRDSQLSFVEYYALAGLSESPNRTMRMSELAVFVNAELSRMSHLIKRLEKRGLVRREPDPTDGRYTNAILTDAGWEHLVRAAPGHVTAVRTLVIDALDKSALDAIKAASDKIIARTEDH